MKRLDCLGDLSREHHTALSLALRARRAAAGSEAEVAAMAAKVRERFTAELEPHFREEERWLLPALAEMGQQSLVERTLADHAELARLVEELAAPSAETLLAFADGLTAHVRFEERELFPAAEAQPDCLEKHRGG
ncbi:MAG: hemerythrin domain-containing protein [Actinomycetota bacterium]